MRHLNTAKLRKKIMVRYFILICLLVLAATHTTYAQVNTISLNLKDVPITQVIDAIKKQTTYRFSYEVELETILKEISFSLNVE